MQSASVGWDGGDSRLRTARRVEHARSTARMSCMVRQEDQQAVDEGGMLGVTTPVGRPA
jgi:hypothetical protein